MKPVYSSGKLGWWYPPFVDKCRFRRKDPRGLHAGRPGITRHGNSFMIAIQDRKVHRLLFDLYDEMCYNPSLPLVETKMEP